MLDSATIEEMRQSALRNGLIGGITLGLPGLSVALGGSSGII